MADLKYPLWSFSGDPSRPLERISGQRTLVHRRGRPAPTARAPPPVGTPLLDAVDDEKGRADVGAAAMTRPRRHDEQLSGMDFSRTVFRVQVEQAGQHIEHLITLGMNVPGRDDPFHRTAAYGVRVHHRDIDAFPADARR